MRILKIIYNTLCFPAALIHEISHILFAHLTGSKILGIVNCDLFCGINKNHSINRLKNFLETVHLEECLK